MKISQIAVVMVGLLHSVCLHAETHRAEKAVDAQKGDLRFKEALARYEQYPGIVRLDYDGTDGFPVERNGKKTAFRRCTGIVVNGCLMTVGHCVAGLTPESGQVKLASEKVLSGITVRGGEAKSTLDVSKLIATGFFPAEDGTPNYYLGRGNDFAIVKLKTPMKGYDSSILAEDYMPVAGQQMTFVGYGLNGEVSDKETAPNESDANLYQGTHVVVGDFNHLSERDYEQIIQTDGTEPNQVASKTLALHNAAKVASRSSIYTKASPNKIGYGDSGAPVFAKDSKGRKKIVGFMAGMRDALGTAWVVSTRDLMPEIRKGLKSLGCEDETPIAKR